MTDSQPLQWRSPIANPDGTPTGYFLRWAQQRLHDIAAGLTEAQLIAILSGIDIIAGDGLGGGGSIDQGRTLHVNPGTGLTITADAVTLADTAITPGTYGDASNVPQFTVDQQGRLTAAANIPVSGGGGGGGGGGGTGGGGYGYEAGPATVPTMASFSWFLQGGATATDNVNGILFNATNDSTVRGIVMAAPSMPFDVYLRFDASVVNNGSGAFHQSGLVFRDGPNGDFIIFQSCAEVISNVTQYYVQAVRYPNTGLSGTTFLGPLRTPAPVKWLRANVTATTITFHVSIDGRDWASVGSELISTFVGAVSQVGFGARVGNAGAFRSMKIQQFGFAGPVVGGNGSALVQLARQDLAGLNAHTFGSIPNGYTDLEIEFFGRTGAAVIADQVFMRVNGLSTAIYDMQRQYAQSTSQTADQALAQNTASLSIAMAGASTAAGMVGHSVMRILGYAQTTLFKSFNVHGRQPVHATSGNAFTISGTGTIRTTAAINSITLYTQSGASFDAGSYAVLRGLA